jgi:hypothetical protein
LDEAKTPYVHILFYFMINSSTLSEIIKDFGNLAKSVCTIFIYSTKTKTFFRFPVIFGV